MKANRPGRSGGAPEAVPISREHDALRDMLAQLEGTMDLRALASLLRELRARLELHFVREEGPEGLHQVVGESAPHLLGYVQRLFDDHARFLSAIDTLAAKTREVSEGPVAALMRDVAAFSDELKLHEARETALLGDAMYTDLGESS